MQNDLTPELAHERKWVIVIYILQLIGFFIGITFIIAVIINYIKEDGVHGTFLETQHRWQIRTFWYSLLWLVVGIITAPIIIGSMVLFANFIWLIYRVIKGLINVIDNKPVLPYQRKS